MDTPDTVHAKDYIYFPQSLKYFEEKFLSLKSSLAWIKNEIGWYVYEYVYESLEPEANLPTDCVSRYCNRSGNVKMWPLTEF